MNREELLKRLKRGQVLWDAGYDVVAIFICASNPVKVEMDVVRELMKEGVVVMDANFSETGRFWLKR